jgi:hypothetical protein
LYGLDSNQNISVPPIDIGITVPHNEDMPAATTTDTGAAGERKVTMTSTTYQLTGDVIADRTAWKAAGCPSDHPYIVACKAQPAGHTVSRPLAIEVTDAQWAAVQAAAPLMRAQSAANIRAMCR